MKTRSNQTGFTIIELLIVIVIIGILAAVTIVAYNGVTKRATAASLQSDLSGARTQLALYQAENGNYPTTNDCTATTTPIPPTICLKSSSGNSFGSTYAPNNAAVPPTYSLQATHGDLTYAVTESTAPVLVAATAYGGVVTTLAGSGVGAFADGTGASAQFNRPSGVAVDSTGTVYVADLVNNRIRSITPAGVVSILAGTGAQGFADGAAASAQFNRPYSVAVDSTGNIYVADYLNNRIRKITPAGVVSTLAGSGVAGFADGASWAAQFNGPISVAVDSAGNVYVADYSNQRIRKVTPAGVVSTLAGSTGGYWNGTGANSQFNWPSSVAVDSAGNVYVADQNNNRIRAITPAGVVSTLAGSGVVGFADGTGASAQFNVPTGVAVDSTGNIYVADQINHRIRKVTPAGVVSTLAGSGVVGFADGASTAAQFNQPIGVAVDSAGNVYVADYSNNRIRKIH